MNSLVNVIFSTLGIKPYEAFRLKNATTEELLPYEYIITDELNVCYIETSSGKYIGTVFLAKILTGKLKIIKK